MKTGHIYLAAGLAAMIVGMSCDKGFTFVLGMFWMILGQFWPEQAK